MPNTPNNPRSYFADIDPATASNEPFGTNLGEKLMETADVSDLTTAPQGRTCNVGLTDQKIRMIGGAALLGAAAFAPLSRNWRIALGACGAFELITGAMRYCPVWHAVGVDTNRIRPR